METYRKQASIFFSNFTDVLIVLVKLFLIFFKFPNHSNFYVQKQFALPNLQFLGVIPPTTLHLQRCFARDEKDPWGNVLLFWYLQIILKNYAIIQATGMILSQKMGTIYLNTTYFWYWKLKHVNKTLYNKFLEVYLFLHSWWRKTVLRFAQFWFIKLNCYSLWMKIKK